MEPVSHNNGRIFQELLQLHMNLRQEVVIYIYISRATVIYEYVLRDGHIQ